MSTVIPERTERKYQPYSEYKDTGLEWLGEIPTHWEVRRLKHISLVKVSGVDKHTKEGEHSIFLCNYGDVYNNETILPTNEFMEATATKKEITTFSLKKGDVIVTKDSEDWKDIAVPSYVAADLSDVICGYHLALIRPSTPMIIGRFLFWALCARSINHQFTIAATGITRFGLSTYWLDNSLFLLPPIQEQQAIAEFLDHETARIDELLAKKQRLIELLQEQRTALITRTVTKGLNTEAPMKDSGVEWLGKIPAYWEIMKLKYAFVLQRGFDLASEDFVDGPYPVCASNGIIGHHIEFTTKGPSVTVGRSGSVGEVNYYESDFWAHNTSLYVRQFLKATPRFVYFLLRVLNLQSLSEGTAVSTLNRNYIHRLLIALPTIQEQQVIAEFLDRETGRIDALTGKINQAIDKLQEYRSALITAAVTGKIDIRGEIVRHE